MAAVYKYLLQITDVQRIPMPERAAPRFVGKDPSGAIALWAEVDPLARLEFVCIRIVGTGHTVGEGWEYLGSVVDGSFVWHVYRQG